MGDESPSPLPPPPPPVIDDNKFKADNKFLSGSELLNGDSETLEENGERKSQER